MAVESRFVVIRQGVEVETFMDKKAADEYDKMLDMADNLSEMFEQAPVELSESIREELSVYLAQNREDVLIALQAKKAKVASKKPVITSQKKTESEAAEVIEAENVTSTEKTKKSKATNVKVSAKTKAAVA
jgi:uncharacterized protein